MRRDGIPYNPAHGKYAHLKVGGRCKTCIIGLLPGRYGMHYCNRVQAKLGPDCAIPDAEHWAEWWPTFREIRDQVIECLERLDEKGAQT